MSLLKSRTPLLHDGDELTPDEFMRRYERMPGVRAELIEGVVYMASPVSLKHGRPHSRLGMLLAYYSMQTRGTECATDITIRLAKKSVPQPDLTLLILPSHGGRTTLSENGYVEGVPELVVEISYSTTKLDATAKKDAYLAAGIDEYILYRVEDEGIDWFRIFDGDYMIVPPDADGLTRSRVFPGLALDLVAILKGDLPTAIARLQSELGSDDHRRFCERLAAAEGRS